MASFARSLKLPADLAEAAERRSKQLGYPSWNAYAKGLIRYDLMVNGSHDITLPMATVPLDEQAKIDSHLLDLVKKGVAQRGQFLKYFLERREKNGSSGEGPN
jgi:hypothetical protein